MKRIFSLLMTAFVLMACGGSKSSAPAETDSDSGSVTAKAEAVETMPQYDITDALSMGFNGHVKHVSAQLFATYESNGELKDGSREGEYEISFDVNGHITNDEWGNEYGYDAEGKYYRGNHTYTTVKRDKEGRLIEYKDVEPKKDNEDDFVQSFRYDKNGRAVQIEYSGFVSSWKELRHYKSGNLYPEKIEKQLFCEGDSPEGVTISYRYTSFDSQNNWTERLCMVSSKEIVEEPVDSFIPEQPKINEKIQVEKRTISYFE